MRKIKRLEPIGPEELAEMPISYDWYDTITDKINEIIDLLNGKIRE